MSNIVSTFDTAPAVKYQPKPERYYFDVALGSILLSGEDTGGAYCLLDLRVAPHEPTDCFAARARKP